MKQGLGDKVEKVTKATGIKKMVEIFSPEGKDCGCESRKQKLNNVTLNRSEPSGCLTKQLFDRWTDFRERKPKALDTDDQQLICDIVREVWKMSFAPCPSCSSTVWAERIKKIDLLYATYEEESKVAARGTSTTGNRKGRQKKKTDGINKEPGNPTAVRG